MINKPAAINSLPPEVFVCIFSLSVPRQCMPFEPDQSRISSYGFVNVCRYWRQIATSTPDLWAHIDISVATRPNLLHLLLERGKNGPINIHLLEFGFVRGIPRYNLPKTIPLLKPHMNRVRSLGVHFEEYSLDTSSLMINQWLDYGDPALVKALEIRVHPDFTRDDILNQLSKSENSEKLLFSISSLLLGSFVFPWDNGIYRNLTSLILAGCTRVTVSELYHILTACSQTLALLELTRAITIEDDTRGRSKYAPVVLHSLKALNLGGVYPANLALLFSLIAIPNFHELDASLPAHEDGQKLLEKFFARCPQLATLYYESVESQGPDWLASQLFRSLPCVNNLLIVHGFRFLDEESTDEDLSESSAPHIPNLILLNCSLTFRVLSSLITKHRVQNLRLELCEIGSLHAGLMDHLRRSLNESFPTLKLTVSNEDSTVLYPIRQPRIWSLA